MNRRRALVVSAIAAAVVALGLPAWAFFTSTTTTVSPTVSAASVNSPGTVSVTTINGTANLSWSTPTTPSGATFSYTVARTAGGGSAGGTCGTSLTATSCQDSGLTPGTSYTWTVTPHLGNNWNGTTSQATTTAAGPLSAFVVTLPGTATAGSAVNMTVTAKDAGGNTVTGYTGTPSFTSSDGQVSLPSGYAFVAADAGSHTYTNGVTFKTAGLQTVTAKDGTPTGTSAGTTVSAAAANSIAFNSGSGQSAVINTAFANPLVALVTDAYGNAVSGVQVTFTAPSTGASATLKASTGACNNAGTSVLSCSVTTGADGKATSSAATANATTGAYNVSASASGLASVNFGLANIANQSVVTALVPSSATQGTNNWRATATATIKDENGAALTGYTVSITFSNGDAGTCTTNSSGICGVTTGNISNNTTSVTATVTNVAKSGGLSWDSTNSVKQVTVNKP